MNPQKFYLRTYEPYIEVVENDDGEEEEVERVARHPVATIVVSPGTMVLDADKPDVRTEVILFGVATCNTDTRKGRGDVFSRHLGTFLATKRLVEPRYHPEKGRGPIAGGHIFLDGDEDITTREGWASLKVRILEHIVEAMEHPMSDHHLFPQRTRLLAQEWLDNYDESVEKGVGGVE